MPRAFRRARRKHVTSLYPLLLIYDKEETMNNSRAPIRLALLAGAALLAVGAAHAADPAPAKSTDNAVVATVNGSALTTRDLAALSRTLAPQGQTLSREEAMQAQVDREQQDHAAEAKGNANHPNVVSELDNQKRA